MFTDVYRPPEQSLHLLLVMYLKLIPQKNPSEIGREQQKLNELADKSCQWIRRHFSIRIDKLKILQKCRRKKNKLKISEISHPSEDAVTKALYRNAMDTYCKKKQGHWRNNIMDWTTTSIFHWCNWFVKITFAWRKNGEYLDRRETSCEMHLRSFGLSSFRTWKYPTRILS